MVIDTSALVAMLALEPEASDFRLAVENATVRFISAATLLEASFVIEARYGLAGGRELDLLLSKAGVDVIPVTAEQVEIARDANRRFGRGRHKAKLNFGDCFSYALAKATGEPLLFKGDDFLWTDVEAAIDPDR